MLHLAQVFQKGEEGNATLRLLAVQKPDLIWALVPGEEWIATTEPLELGQGCLVLVELNSDRQILTVTDATDWILDVVQKYLIYPYTPAFLQQEAERAEQWRQSLTLESQELGRRTLELEARREQIEALESNLKQERQQLEMLATQLRMTNTDES
ncbi:MAG: hypothetical protein SFW36_06610 [Leptolyngbyaceae cyanobacterium bins.59]|nr:hypothetical protein [Leptolyngbyaceae cyanobacterium bins.59]